MKRTVILAGVLLGFTGSALAEPFAGYDRLTVAAKHRPAPIAASIWYPVGTPTYLGRIGEGALFRGAKAYVGAAIAEGSFPLVLLSHGSGGNMDALAWLSSELALRGALVLAVNHPGSTTGDSSPRRSIRLQERAADLTAALDQVLADPVFASHIDPARISAFGFSLGGATALNLAGARLDRGRYRDYCAAQGQSAPDCVFFAKGGVDLDKLPAAWIGDQRDPRVSAAVAVDPAFTYAVTEKSVAAMKLPVLLINLGGKERWAAVDVGPEGSDLSGRLPEGAYAVFGPANHFTFLAVCKPGAAKILAEQADDPICSDPEGADRAGVHEQIVARVADFLGL